MMRKRLIVLFITAALCLATTSRALAVTTTQSSGANIKSRFFPTDIQTTLTTDTVSDYSYQWMKWANDTRREAISVPDSAYEHEAFTPSQPCWLGSYDRDNWGSNLPTAYLDTEFDDTPGNVSRAGGSAAAIALESGVFYYHWLRLLTSCGVNSDPYKIKSQDSRRSPATCSSSYEFCVFAEAGPFDWVPYDQGLHPGPTYAFSYNQLTNPSFEQDFGSWVREGSGSVSIYGGGIEGAKFAEFNCGSGPVNCSIFTDKPFDVKTNGVFTYEVALRCAAGASCPVSVGLWGYGISGNELGYKTFTIQGTGGWGRYGFVSANYQPHNLLRLQIYNGSAGNNLDVDFGTLHWSDNVEP